MNNKYITKTRTIDSLAIKHNCDKSSEHHDYCKIYDQYLFWHRDKQINFLEIGYGGYTNPNEGGESARVWLDFFTNATINIVELHEKYNVPERVNMLYGSQDDPKVFESLNNLDLVIDDGSHISHLTISSFEIVWPKLKSGGLYIIEDLHSSYTFPYYIDANPNPNEGRTIMNYLKRLADEINADFLDDQYKFGLGIEYMHFYKDLVIIKKK